MLTNDELEPLLHALATGYSDRAKNVVETAETLDEAERDVLRAIVWSTDSDGAAMARSIGDVLRLGGAAAPMVNECYRVAFYASGQSVALATSNPLYAAFLANRSGRLLDKWVHYFPIYHRHLAPYRGAAPRVLEIGVFHGGSLDLWRRYFGEGTITVGLDIDEDAAVRAASEHVVVIGDQSDPEVLRSIVDRHGPFDVIIDDGGHRVEQQIASIEALFPTLRDGGTYVVEDCHTSYWDEFGGGLRKRGTFIEWVKNRLDDLNGYHRPEPVAPWTETVDAMHCYDSVVVLDKALRPAPFCEQNGDSHFVFEQRPISILVGEMVATRDAAVVERDTARADLAAMMDAAAEEQRLERGELSELRPRFIELQDRLRAVEQELEVTRNDLLEAWEQVRGLRATLSWRLTAPIRGVRRRLGPRA